jgi:ribosome biogenesis GTPase
MNLNDLGWSNDFEQSYIERHFDGTQPARVAREEKIGYIAIGKNQVWSATLTGRLRSDAALPIDRPAVGDWVALQPIDSARAVIHSVLPRRSAFVRQVAGRRSDQQVVAANIDVVFLVAGLDGDFNLRRLERYLTLAHASGASPVVLLNKADLCAEIDARLREVDAIAPSTPVHAVSALDGDGLQAVRAHLHAGRTAALLGSSGVGKSTLLNTLLGRVQQTTQSVRESDDRGRHTTTHRELFVLPDGGIVIDTPGMRELQLPAGSDDLSDTFADIEELAGACRFGDCAHESEPGCAVRAAIDKGEIDARRWAGFQKLQRELHFAAIREDPAALRERRDAWKKIHKAAKKRMKARRKW